MYEAYFGLKEAPFSLSPDPRFIFLTRQHQEALAKCQYAIAQRMGISLIYGDIGAGKTSLARRLWEQYAAHSGYNFAMLVHPNYPSPFQLIKQIRREFGRPRPRRSLADELVDLQDFLIEQHQQGRINVLVVDEAQRLKPPLFELLRQLLNFETSTAKLLQIVLFGQNELTGKVERQPELKDRVTIFGALTSLTREDADALIAFRWQVAGGEQPPFTQAAREAIFHYGRGLPRKICNLCNNALIRACSAEQRQVDVEIIEQVAAEIRLSQDAGAQPRASQVGRKPKEAVST
jgi:general secretion pathway protein A